MTIEKMNRIIFVIIIVLITNCKSTMNSTNKFLFEGDQGLLNNLKVNVKFYTDTKSDLFTIYNQGKKINYQYEGVRFYEVYLSYKDNLFAYFSFDDVERALGPEVSKAKFYVLLIDGNIYVSRSKMDKNTAKLKGTLLLPYKKLQIKKPNINETDFTKIVYHK